MSAVSSRTAEAIRPKTPVSLSVLGAAGVQYAIELRPAELEQVAQTNGIRLLDCRETVANGSSSGGCGGAFVPHHHIGQGNLNSAAQVALLGEENARLRDALSASRTHPISRTLAGAQFGRARTPDGSRPRSRGGIGLPDRPGSRGGLGGRALQSSGLNPSGLELAHEQMINLGRAYMCDKEGLPDMESWQSLKPLHRRKPGGLKPGDSMTRRIAELEAMIEQLEHMLKIRDKEIARLRMKNSALEMQNRRLEAELARLRGTISSLESKIVELEAFIAAQAAELDELRAWKEEKLNERKPEYADAGVLACQPVSHAVAQTTFSMPHEELERLRSLTKLQEQQLSRVGDTDWLKAELQRAKDQSDILAGKLEKSETELASTRDNLAAEQTRAFMAERKQKELRSLMCDKDKDWGNKMLAALESLKIAVVSPKVEVRFGAGGTVTAVPTIPRSELESLLQDDILPEFSRIFTERTPDVPPELLEKSSNEPDSGWLEQHIDDIRATVTERLESLFAPAKDETVRGRRAAAGSLARSPHRR